MVVIIVVVIVRMGPEGSPAALAPEEAGLLGGGQQRAHQSPAESLESHREDGLWLRRLLMPYCARSRQPVNNEAKPAARTNGNAKALIPLSSALALYGRACLGAKFPQLAQAIVSSVS